MKPLRYTLITDGPSDRALIPIIDWVLSQLPHVTICGFSSNFADLRNQPMPSDPQEAPLVRKARAACGLFPCDVLFVHRDAESVPLNRRIEEVQRQIAQATNSYVPVVPVRMTEAWLLISESAIRRAADNPNGRIDLTIPLIQRLEALPDPKKTLNELLVRASEKRGRRLDKFRRPSELAFRRFRVAQLTDDFAPLRRLTAFQRFEQMTRETLAGWRQ